MIVLVVVGLASRLYPHPPNMTAMNAIALLGTYYVGSRWRSWVVLWLALFLSDMALGLHATMPSVYFSVGLIVILGERWGAGSDWLNTACASCAAATLFFLITNLGVWIGDTLYPRTWEGLYLCYAAAIPFWGNQIGGDLFYGLLLGPAAKLLMAQRRIFLGGWRGVKPFDGGDFGEKHGSAGILAAKYR